MYGTYVDYAGFTVWVWCVPTDNEYELRRLAERKIAYAKSLGLSSEDFILYLKGELQATPA